MLLVWGTLSGSVGPRIPAPMVRLQDRLAELIGSGPTSREPILAQMLERDAKSSIAYWLQLGVSVGIATLGLVLGSTAVVIAAMLVAPLMGPIVGLGMGLATGGPFLTLRAAQRVALSVLVVIAGAAGVTVLLPFHEMNAELAARTVPTALDLITAAFCALAGAYAAVRTTSDTATTAAGTSIGISLVPPLCTAGFCLGTGQWTLAFGASLLFLTNMVAIVLVGMAAFLALGFNQVPIAALESEHLARETGERVVRGVARQLARLFASRWGSWLRMLMPVALVGVVYVPLRRALDEVTWQVQVRTGARALLDEIDAEVVSSRLRVERHQVEAMVIVIGSRADADALQHRIETELARISGVTPRVDVRAVPDAEAAAAVTPIAPPTASEPVTMPEAPPAPFAERLGEVHSELVEAIHARWPAASAGQPLAIGVDATAADLTVYVVHVGAPVDDAAREVLERSLAVDLDVGVTLVDDVLPSKPIVEVEDDAAIAHLASLLARARLLAQVHTCVVEPAPEGPVVDADVDGIEISEPAAEVPSSSPPLRTAVRALLAGQPRVEVREGDAWALWFAIDGCPADAG